MADTPTDTEDKPNMLPLIIGVVVVGAIIAFVMMRKKAPAAPPAKRRAALPETDPCEGMPEWACATASLLNPLATASVDIYKAKASSDLEAARLRAGR
jgi:hypothetical protein